MKKPMSNAEKSAEINRKIRKDWGMVNPVMRVEEDKRKKYERKPKHQKPYDQD